MFTTLLAHTEGWRDGPGPWALVPLTFFLIWLTIAVVVVLRVRRHGPPWTGATGRSVLDERYARGEIGVDEYRDRRAVLEERRR